LIAEARCEKAPVFFRREVVGRGEAIASARSR
jgi:hypothetical protein